MGNCQAAEAATVVIHHPGGKVERAYWSLSASQVMAANPGHYVAVIVDGYPSRHPPPALQSSTSSFRAYRSCSGSSSAGGTAPVKHLKLLRPDDALHIGHVYRLISFEGRSLYSVLLPFPCSLQRFEVCNRCRGSERVRVEEAR